MRILVTGATGFVGQHLIPVLSHYHSLLCIVRDIQKAKTLYGDDVEYLHTNELSSVKDFGPEIVVHLASYLTSQDDSDSMHKLLEANIVFGTELLNALRNCKIKLFINIGSFAEYRLGPASTDSAYLYTATKTAFKSILKYYADIGGYPYVHLIPYTIYGGNDTKKKIFDYVKDSLDSVKPIDMTLGEQILDFIHVDDVVECINYFIDHMDIVISKGLVDYHLGTGRGMSIRDLAAFIETKYGKKTNISWGARPYRPRDVMYAVAPIGNLIDIGYRAKRRIEDYL